MKFLRPTSWLLSLGLHLGLLTGLVGVSGGVALEAGSGSDLFVVEQGVALEGVAKLGDAEETIETTDISPAQATLPQPVEEIKPDQTDVITSTESPVEEQIAAEEPPPVVEKRPVDIPVKEQVPQVAMLTEKSSGAAQKGGDTTVRRHYLGALRKTLERSKVNPRIHLAGTVLIAFTVSPSGQVLSRTVKKSSGSKSLDDAAIAALDRASPFPPMPNELARAPLEVQVPFKFVAH